MGWTSYHVEPKYKKGKPYIDRKEECDKLFNQPMVTMESREPIGKYEVIKSSVVSTTYYAAVKMTRFAEPEKAIIFAAVVLTTIDNDSLYNFSYKDMEESMGPCKYDCPIGILDLLSPTENKYALEWRAKCRENHRWKSSPTSLHKLPVGTRIKFKAPFDMKLYKKGDEITVWKTNKATGGTYWIDGHYAYPARVIGHEYEIVEAK